MCFLFLISVCNIFSIKNALIFEISIFSDREVNLVSTFGRSKLKISSGFRECQEKQKKNRKKFLIFTQNYF